MNEKEALLKKNHTSILQQIRQLITCFPKKNVNVGKIELLCTFSITKFTRSRNNRTW